MSIKDRTASKQGVLLLAGDLICFLVFAALGLRSHEDGITPSSVLRAAGPFQAGWLLAGLAPVFRETRSAHRTTGVLRRWLPAWGIGMVLRTLLFDRSFSVSFAIVSFVTVTLILFVWRSLIARVLWPSRDNTPG